VPTVRGPLLLEIWIKSQGALIGVGALDGANTVHKQKVIAKDHMQNIQVG
jgi:hypothetical protein